VARARTQSSEQAIAEVVVAYLDALGADTYQEVEVVGGVADIVARVGAECWIVEVKTSLSLSLICQARARRRHAHRVLIAAPPSRNMGEVRELCAELGVGLLEVCLGSPGWNGRSIYEGSRVQCLVESRRWNTRPVKLTAKLRPEHKTSAKAGTVSAAWRWTPFRSTCAQLAQIVQSSPGISLAKAVEQTQHHYATKRSAHASLAKWISEGAVPGVVAKRSHGTHGALELWPEGAR
jgi:hypothetical protein